jgi:hypothetical protein
MLRVLDRHPAYGMSRIPASKGQERAAFLINIPLCGMLPLTKTITKGNLQQDESDAVEYGQISGSRLTAHGSHYTHLAHTV